jgi:fluoride exporter
LSRGLEVVLLSVGGALGVNARHWLAVWMSGWAGSRFPWATFAINVSGSFAIGLLATILARWLPDHRARLFLLVGFLGGYTTFSSFAFEGQILWERGEVARSLAYLGGSVAAGFVAVVLGIMLGRAVVGPEAPSTMLVANDIRGIEE